MDKETLKDVWVLFGCAHSGLINTLEQVSRITDSKSIEGIIGDIHFVGATEERLSEAV